MFDHQGAAVLHFQTIHIDHQLGVTCQFVFGSLENMMVLFSGKIKRKFAGRLVKRSLGGSALG